MFGSSLPQIDHVPALHFSAFQRQIGSFPRGNTAVLTDCCGIKCRPTIRIDEPGVLVCGPFGFTYLVQVCTSAVCICSLTRWVAVCPILLEEAGRFRLLYLTWTSCRGHNQLPTKKKHVCGDFCFCCLGPTGVARHTKGCSRHVSCTGQTGHERSLPSTHATTRAGWGSKACSPSLQDPRGKTLAQMYKAPRSPLPALCEVKVNTAHPACSHFYNRCFLCFSQQRLEVAHRSPPRSLPPPNGTSHDRCPTQIRPACVL